ncbi:DUF4097 family beta strand repeat-containing protein [Paenibacillus gansuensis]|uniref:DUF4097 family beta strand repeat-containing protein n=1 Tax=Paenibacillus gansuensis TaxID=306542 RepID=A0ABW5PJT4_9BACL
MIRIGRITASLMLITVGAVLLVDRFSEMQYAALLPRLWPAVLIVLGLEFIVISLVYRNAGRKLRVNVGSLLLAGVISAGVTAYSLSPSVSWSGIADFFISMSTSSSMERGNHIDRGLTRIPLTPQIQKVKLNNPNGKVTLLRGNVEGIEIHTDMWIDQVNKQEAEKIAEGSNIVYGTTGDLLEITAQGQKYSIGSKRKPRMNLTVTVPDTALDWSFEMTNGTLTVSGVPVREQLRANHMNGTIFVTDIAAAVELETTNGSIHIKNIQGDAELKSTNGNVTVSQVKGNVEAHSTNGKLEADAVTGKAELKTTNGKITVNGVTGELAAHTTNGSITAASSVIGGDWQLKTTNGGVEASLPENGNFEVDGSTGAGSIATDLPLQLSKRSIGGTIGSGQYKVEIRTNHSAIRITEYK